MEHYFHIDLNDENYLTQIQNMVSQLQTSIITYQNNQTQESNPHSSQNQENYLIQFEFDVQIPQQNNQENLPNYFKNCAEIDQELGPALYIQKKDPILDKNECLICMEKFEYKKYKRKSLKKADGYYEICYRSGSTYERYSLKNNEKDGLYESYYDNAQLERKSEYKDGYLDGVYESYHSNGQLKEKINYDDRKKNGDYELYYDNAQLRQKTEYKDGYIKGVYEAYYSDGQLEEKTKYKNRKNIKDIYYKYEIKIKC